MKANVMKTMRSIWYICALLVTIVLPALPAQAQASRTWVSGVGDDVNPCSRTAPCKTFQGAISKTATGGEINVLDPGGFGAVTITKSISIISERFEAGVLVSGTNAIIVNLPNATDKVLIEGLDIEGLGTGLDAVKIIGNGSTTVRRSSIRRFTGNGVNVVGASGARVFVQDSIISYSGGGVNVQGSAVNGSVANSAVIADSTFDTLTNFAVRVSATGQAFVAGSKMIGPGGPKLVIDAGGGIVSAGDNVVRGASAAFSSIFPKQ
ncbi:MAG: hypothetical protein QOD74_3113 [Variibacter sp.]|jgi:hypothetical protein|nr:hypothetical protein [Variibacter sp.]